MAGARKGGHGALRVKVRSHRSLHRHPTIYNQGRYPTPTFPPNTTKEDRLTTRLFLLANEDLWVQLRNQATSNHALTTTRLVIIQRTYAYHTTYRPTRVYTINYEYQSNNHPLSRDRLTITTNHNTILSAN